MYRGDPGDTGGGLTGFYGRVKSACDLVRSKPSSSATWGSTASTPTRSASGGFTSAGRPLSEEPGRRLGPDYDGPDDRTTRGRRLGVARGVWVGSSRLSSGLVRESGASGTYSGRRRNAPQGPKGTSGRQGDGRRGVWAPAPGAAACAGVLPASAVSCHRRLPHRRSFFIKTKTHIRDAHPREVYRYYRSTGT